MKSRDASWVALGFVRPGKKPKIPTSGVMATNTVASTSVTIPREAYMFHCLRSTAMEYRSFTPYISLVAGHASSDLKMPNPSFS